MKFAVIASIACLAVGVAYSIHRTHSLSSAVEFALRHPDGVLAGLGRAIGECSAGLGKPMDFLVAELGGRGIGKRMADLEARVGELAGQRAIPEPLRAAVRGARVYAESVASRLGSQALDGPGLRSALRDSAEECRVVGNQIALAIAHLEGGQPACPAAPLAAEVHRDAAIASLIDPPNPTRPG